MVSNIATQQHNGVVNNKAQIRRSRALGACSLVMLVAAIGFSTSSIAAPITVPNGDFSNSANDGQIGGGLIGGSGRGVIGTGPWNGTYKGVASLLAPPLLTIGNHEATISGLLGVNVLGIVDNSGYFSQSLTTAYEANEHYVLTANVDASVPLNVGILNTGNAGIALTQGTNVLAATGTTGAIVSLSLLSGTRYKLTLAYDTGATVSGNIGVRLFAKPQNLVTANLLTAVSFTNVTLSGSAINPTAASVASGGGTPQSATVDMPFAIPLTVTVLDAEGDPVQGVNVTFSAPTSGPSATLSTPLPTDINGQTQVTGTANGIAGSYVITATVNGVATAATFDLTNTAGGPSLVGSATGSPQSATVNTNFTTPLGVTVTDADGNPLQGVTVTFASPNSGASANFPNGATAISGPDGVATIDAMANMVAGSYVVTATAVGATTSATFALTNSAGPAASAVAMSGTPQNAQVSTAFNVPLSAEIKDAFGNGVPNVTVTFTAPASGASATFSPSATATTDANGFVSINATANDTAGTYTVDATSNGVATDATFTLTNTTTMTPIVTTTSGTNQQSNVEAAFSCLLQLKVTSDGTTPLPNMAINFVAPTSGPSSILSNGVDSGQQVTVMTDSNGLAGVTATANSVPGAYDISAEMQDGSMLATYQLTNLDNDRLFADGFENTPAVCGN